MNERQQVEKLLSQFSGFHRKYFNLLSAYFGDSCEDFKPLFPYYPSDPASGTHLSPITEDETFAASRQTIPYSLTSIPPVSFLPFPRKDGNTTFPRTTGHPRKDGAASEGQAALAACNPEEREQLSLGRPGKDVTGVPSSGTSGATSGTSGRDADAALGNGRAGRGNEGRTALSAEGVSPRQAVTEGRGIGDPLSPSPEEQEGLSSRVELSSRGGMSEREGQVSSDRQTVNGITPPAIPDGKKGGRKDASLPGEGDAAASAELLLSSGFLLPAGGAIITEGASLFYRERRGTNYYRIPLPVLRGAGGDGVYPLPREERGPAKGRVSGTAPGRTGRFTPPASPEERKNFPASPEERAGGRMPLAAGPEAAVPDGATVGNPHGRVNAYSSYFPLPDKGRQAAPVTPDRESYISFCFSLISCFPTPRTIVYLRSALLSLFSVLEGTVDRDIAESVTRTTGLSESDERADYQRLRNLIKTGIFMETGKGRGQTEGRALQCVLTEKGFNTAMNYFISNRKFFSFLGIDIPVNLLEIFAPLYKSLKASRYYKTDARKDEHTRMESLLYANLLLSPSAIDRLAILSLTIEDGAAPEPGATGFRTRASYDVTDAYSDLKESVDLTALNNECHEGIPSVAGIVPNRYLRRDICYEVDRGTEPLALPRQGDTRTSITGKVLSYASRFEATRSCGDVVFLVCESREERREREALSRQGKRARATAAPSADPGTQGPREAVQAGAVEVMEFKSALNVKAKSVLPAYTDLISGFVSPATGEMSLALTGLSANLYGFLAFNEELIPSPQGEGNAFSLDEMSMPYTETLPGFREYVRSHGKAGGTHGENGDIYALLEEEALRCMEPYAELIERYRSGNSSLAGGEAPDGFMRYALSMASAEKADVLKKQREKIEGALRAFASEIINSLGAPSAPGGDAPAGNAVSSLPGEAGQNSTGQAATEQAASYLSKEGAFAGGRGTIVKGSRAHGMLMALTENGRSADPEASLALRTSFLNGMSAAAVFPSALSDLYMVCPERWFGRRGILNAIMHLGLYCPSGEAPALSYRVPLVYCSGAGQADGAAGGRRSGRPSLFTRLCLWDGSRRIAVENVSNDIGGLLRAREYITRCPAGACRTTLMICLINDSLILADGTHLSEGSLVKNPDGTLARFTDVDARKVSDRDVPALSELSAGTPYSELSYYAKRVGSPYTLPESLQAAAGGSGDMQAAGGTGTAESRSYRNMTSASRAMAQTASMLASGPVPVTQLSVLPMLYGITRDYVFVTYSQFFSAAAGFDRAPFTWARGTAACVRAGYPSDSVCPSYRAVQDQSPWSDYVIRLKDTGRNYGT